MKIYFKYKLCRLLKLSAIVLCFLTLLIWITQSFRIFDLIINNNIKILDFAKLSISILPFLLYNILPFAVLITAFIETQRMAREREILVLQCNSYDRLEIAQPFIATSMIITVMSIFLSCYFMPASYKQFKELQFKIQKDYASFLLEKGAFISKIKGLTFYISNKSSSNHMYGITINDTRVPEKNITITAKKAHLINLNDNIIMVLHDGTRQEINTQNNKLTLITFQKYTLNLKLDALFSKKYVSGPNEKYINQLFYEAFLEKDSSIKHHALVRLHSRILWPLFIILIGVMPIALTKNWLSYRQINKYEHIKVIIYCSIIVSCFILSESLSFENISWLPMMYFVFIIPSLAMIFKIRDF